MSWRRIFTSEEAWIESMAGACPPDDWPMPPRDQHTTEPRRTQAEEEAFDPWTPQNNWPMPKPPPYEADDEDDAAPWRAYCRAYSPRSLIGEGHPRIRPGNEDTP